MVLEWKRTRRQSENKCSLNKRVILCYHAAWLKDCVISLQSGEVGQLHDVDRRPELDMTL